MIHDYRTVWSDLLQCWVMDLSDDALVPVGLVHHSASFERRIEPLEWFQDPEQIRLLTPEINWDRRVGDRIRQFLEWGTVSRN